MSAARLRCCVVALILLAPASAAAQHEATMTVAQKKVAARTKGEEGFTLFEEGKWQGAYELFSEAEAHFHTPSFVLYMARSKRKLGKLLEARALYARVLNELLPGGVPGAFREAQTSASSEVDELEALVPSLHIAVEGAPMESVRVRINGVISSTWQDGMDLNPGVHTVEVGANGMATVMKSVKLVEGTSERIAIGLVPQSSNEAPVPVPAPLAIPYHRSEILAPADTAPEITSKTLGIVSLSAGGVGIFVGAVTGLAAMEKRDEVTNDCAVSNRCSQSQQSDLDESGTLGTVSIVSLIAGGVGLGVGTYLLLTGSDSKPTVKASVSPWLGAGYAGVKGTF